MWRERLDILWRSAATGFCFAVFGLGQLGLAVTAFPLALLLSGGGGAKSARLAKRVLHHTFQIFIWIMHRTRVLDYTIHGKEKLARPGLLVLANHPTLIDYVFLTAFMPQVDCVVKGSLFSNPFCGFAVRSAGYISSDLDPDAVVEACRASMAEQGNSLIVFPEGTRTTPGQPLTLRRSAAQIAVRARRDITPVVIRATEHNLGKGDQWWNPPRRRPNFVFEVREDLAIEPWLGSEPSQAARQLTDFLTDYFRKETTQP